MISFSFKNVQHGLATFFQKTVAALKQTSTIVEAIEAKKSTIEAVSAVAAAAVGGPAAATATTTIEDAAFAALASLDAAIKDGGAAAEANLLNAGVDQTAIDAVKAVGVQSVGIYTLLKAQTVK
jgi:hypothetical protein